jgi:hypothetical protein
MRDGHARPSRAADLEIYVKQADGSYTTSCRGFVKSAVGPAGHDGKWECPVCGRRVKATKTGWLYMHRAKGPA